MKVVDFLKVVLLTMLMSALCVSCSPSAEEMAKEYQKLAAELTQAKLAGDEDRAEAVMEEMEDLNENIARETKKNLKKTGKKVEKKAKKVAKDAENAFEDLVK